MGSFRVILQICLLFASSHTLAQEVLDPLPGSSQLKVSYLSEGFYNLNEKVYFFGHIGMSHSILELDPSSNNIRRVAEVPPSYLNWPSYFQKHELPDSSNIHQIGNRLLMGDERMGIREWFDPLTGAFVSAFAKKPSVHTDNCKLSGWDNGPLLACTLAYDAEYPRRQIYYRLEAADGLFHQLDTFKDNQSSFQITLNKGLFCYQQTIQAQQRCSEWPSLITYTAPEGNSTLVVQHKHIFWMQENGNILMQQRHSAKQTILSTRALEADPYAAGSIGVNPENLLYISTDANGANPQVKRLNFASQQIENVSIGIPIRDYWYQNKKTWQQELSINRDITPLSDGGFLSRSHLGGINLLTSNSTTHQEIQADLYTRYELCCHQLIAGVAELNEELFVVGDSCLVLNATGSIIYTKCKGSAPTYFQLSSKQQHKHEIPALLLMPDTQVRHLTAWKQHLFWYEKNEQWRIKRYNPKNQQIDIVSTLQPDFYWSSRFHQLLPGSTRLWQRQYGNFYAFNPETQRFETTGTTDAKVPDGGGILIDDDFYYVFSEYSAADQSHSTIVRRFNLNSGQYHTLKTISNTNSAGLLGVHAGKLYLSFATADHKPKGGILNLSDLTLDENQAFADSLTYPSTSMLLPVFTRLYRVFEFRQQLYGISAYDIRNYDFGGGTAVALSKLDLTNQTRNRLPGREIHPVNFQQPRVVPIGEKLFANWGLQYDKDGSLIFEPAAGPFYLAAQFLDSTYLLSENKLEKWTVKNGILENQGNLLEKQSFADNDATMVELGGKLYFVAKDTRHGERIRIIQLPNRLPIAKDDNATTNNSSKITIPVLSNDTDPDFDVMRVQEAKATQGLVSIEPDQQLSYQPKAGFVGSDEIQYQVTDGRGGIATAKVSITVTATEVPPITKPEAPAEKSGGSLTFGWLALLWCAAQFRSRWNSKSK